MEKQSFLAAVRAVIRHNGRASQRKQAQPTSPTRITSADIRAYRHLLAKVDRPNGPLV